MRCDLILRKRLEINGFCTRDDSFCCVLTEVNFPHFEAFLEYQLTNLIKLDTKAEYPTLGLLDCFAHLIVLNVCQYSVHHAERRKIYGLNSDHEKLNESAVTASGSGNHDTYLDICLFNV